MITIIRVKLHNKNISELLINTQWFSSAKESRMDNDLKSNEHYYFSIKFRRFLITIIIFVYLWNSIIYHIYKLFCSNYLLQPMWRDLISELVEEMLVKQYCQRNSFAYGNVTLLLKVFILNFVSESPNIKTQKVKY